MEPNLIATTRNAELQPLASGGQSVTDVWQQIAGHLGRTLGPAHAAFLAEPQPDQDRGVTDWYSTAEGGAAVLEEMPEPAREAGRATLTRLVQEVQAEIAKLRASRRDADKLLAELLALALVTPSPSSVRMVGTQPVLVAWGHAAIHAPPAPELLLGQLSRAPGIASGSGNMEIVGPPPPEAVRRPWLAMAALLLALLLLLLLALLLWRDPFGWFRAPPQQCVVEPGGLELMERLRLEQDREGQLRQQIARELQRLGDRRLACPPVPRPPEPRPPEPVPTPAPPPPQPSPDAERARREGARSGRIQVILAWDDVNDLDLSVVCPNGRRIDYRQTSACGGTLDVDRNAGGSGTNRPVENVVFERDPPPGRYRIEIHHFASYPGGPRVSPWRVTLRREGRPDETFSGQIATGQRVTVTTFDVP